MISDNRKKQILDILNKNGSVRVTELSSAFKVSEVTIRNYLADMESQGLLTRIHGGAISSYKPYFNMNFKQRLVTNDTQKNSIAQKISSMIEPNDSIILNSGTTTLFVFRNLPKDYPLTIITNSVAVALEAASNPNFDIILVGGTINAKYQSTYGNDAIEQLKKYHVDKLILSVDGIDFENGFSTYFSEQIYIDRTMLSCSDICIVAADHTKLRRNALSNIADISVADYIVTDGVLEDEEVSQLRSHGIDIINV